MSRLLGTTVVLSSLLLAGMAAAQPGPGAGGGPGPNASAPRAGMGPGRGAMMGGRFGNGVTPGWSMMSAEERTAHRNAMRDMKNYDDCVAYRDKHHEAMQARAKEKGVTPPAAPRRDVCAALKK